MRRHPKSLFALLTLLASLALGVTLADAIAPTVTVDNASEVEFISAKASGEVDPQGVETFCHFEYLTQGEWEANANAFPAEGAPSRPCDVEPLSGSGLQAVKADLTELQPATTYHLRLVANNVEGESANMVAGETFTTKAVAKPALTIANAAEVTGTAAKASGTVEVTDTNPAFDAACHFEYVTQAKFAVEEFTGASTVPCEPTPVKGAEPQPVDVEATLANLEPHTVYHLQLVASNAGGQSEEAAPATFETAPVAPDLALTYPADSTASTQTLRAFVNPHNSALTKCEFEYGTTTSYGQSAPCSPIGTPTNQPTLVTAALSGLSPNTQYHYRLLTASPGGPAQTADATFETLSTLLTPACPNPTFHTGTSANLPDCRAYEMVSPPNKNGAAVAAYAVRTRAAADGSALQFASNTGFGDARSSAASTDYLARRDAAPGTNGWSTHAISAGNFEPSAYLEQIYGTSYEPTYRGELSPDLSHGVILSVPPRTADPDVAAVPNLYLADDLLSPGERHFQLLTACPGCATTGPLLPISEPELPEFAGASADFSHVIFESIQNLTDDAQGLEPNKVKLYEWTASPGGASVSLVGQVPASGSECGGGGEPPCVAAPRSEGGPGVLVSSAAASPASYAPNAISQDGSRVYFTEPIVNGSAGRLYLRAANGTPAATTVQLNVAEPTPNPSPLNDGRYWTATPDGRYAYFTTRENLLTADTSNENFTDLYRFDAEAPAGQALTLISAPDPGLTANVQGALGVSDDGGYTYFVSSRQLLSGQPDSDGSKIFVWHDGTIREVAAIADPEVGPITGGGRWVSDPKASRLTSDGTHLLFASRNQHFGDPDGLPHDPFGDACEVGQVGRGCSEVYLYDATAEGGAGSLACLSCTRPDRPAHGPATFISRGAGVLGVASHLNHPLSAEGRYAFFNTPERLVPEDTNGVGDVYEYDSLTGERHLLSSGAGKEPSTFMDASLDGSDVFFATGERLSGWDTDNSTDLYDAHAGGGLPEPSAPPASCQGDACQPAPPSLNDPTPASSSFSGAGNLTNCPKGKVKKNGKCVRKHHKKHHKKAHNKTGHNRGGSK